jgi:hypothetical protein
MTTIYSKDYTLHSDMVASVMIPHAEILKNRKEYVEAKKIYERALELGV